MRFDTAEHRRLADSEARRADWKQWGPYVAERAWGTVREDYSATGDAWGAFPFEHAHRRAFRWNEDGLGGFCNRFQNVCLGLALWNGRDPILKERLFGLAGPQGNHGEDVKELYWYLDGVPSHAFMSMLYRYPLDAYPYRELVEVNAARSRDEPEFELTDALAGALAARRFVDVFVEYAKRDEQDILCRIRAVNRADEPATIDVLPQIWYRNVWSWDPARPRPTMVASDAPDGVAALELRHKHLDRRWWYCRAGGGGEAPALLVTDNDTNRRALFGTANEGPFTKDAIGRLVVDGERDAVNPERRGTKAAAHLRAELPPGGSLEAWVRFCPAPQAAPFDDFAATFEHRRAEADEFYAALHPPDAGADERRVQREALAGLLWNKQFYHYAVDLWLDGDPGQPAPPAARRDGRNREWRHVYNLDVLSMPDSWEYPWFAAWDLAFHTVPLAVIDPEWAKRQLILMLREWYMHPNGQIPAYEWNFGDVNPPVHAWAALRVYRIEREMRGTGDTVFLERVFQKLLLNFTWWVNRKDRDGRNVFQGGFLGLDNIGVFDRSRPLPDGSHLEQSDGTAWMGMYCLNMLQIALELATHGRPYEDVAQKFFEHFVWIANAINGPGGALGGEHGLWDDEDGFYYDSIHTPGGRYVPVKVRSMIGLIPLFAVATIEDETLAKLGRFRRRMEWFVRYRPHLVDVIASLTRRGESGRRLLSLVGRGQLERILARMLDPEQFLSPHGLRSMSREHLERPFSLTIAGERHTVGYERGESRTPLFGGNSNWRGPVWFPVNYLMIEALRTYHGYWGDRVRVPCPTGAGEPRTLDGVADELSRRLVSLFRAGDDGRRPYRGPGGAPAGDPLWDIGLMFHEYFDGDDGRGLGACQQTGWTALVAELIRETGR